MSRGGWLRENRLMAFVVAGLVVGIALAMLIGPFASSKPDGLEKVSSEEGFATGTDHDLVDGPLANYGVRGVDHEKLSTAAAGGIGVLVTFGVGLGVFVLMKRAQPRGTEPPRTSLPSE